MRAQCQHFKSTLLTKLHSELNLCHSPVIQVHNYIQRAAAKVMSHTNPGSTSSQPGSYWSLGTNYNQGQGPISWPTPSGTMYLWTSVLSRHRLFAAAYDLPDCSCLTWKVLVGIPAPVWYVSVWGFSTLLNLKDTSAAPRRWPSTSACYQNTFQVLAHQDMNLEPSTSQQMLQTQ